MKKCTTCKIEKEYVGFSKHKSKIDGYSDQCKQCVNKYYKLNIDKKKKYQQLNKTTISERQKKHYQLNKPELLERQKKQYQLNKTIISLKKKKYYQLNKTAIIESRNQNFQLNKTTIIESRKQYYKLNKILLKEQKKKYYQTEKGKLIRKARDHKRRILKIQNTPSGKHFTADDIKLKLRLQHCKCIYCHNSIKKYYEIDHIIPLCKGGSNESSNIQLLCKDCNKSGGKGTKDAIEYAQQHGMLC